VVYPKRRLVLDKIRMNTEFNMQMQSSTCIS
jgi:hypothetical protein